MLPRPTTDLDIAKSDMETFGYCIVKNLLDDDELKAIRTRFLEQVEAEEELGIKHLLPDRKQLVFFLLNKGKIFQRLILDQKFLQIVEHILGDAFLLSSYNGHIAHPGGDTAYHTDQFWMPPPTTPSKETLLKPGSITRLGNRGHHVGGDALVDTPSISPAVVCNGMWALDDFTAENGATLVVPKSHLTGRQPDAILDQNAHWVPAEAPAGSVIIFEGRTWHSTGINTSNSTRIGLTTNYCSWQFRQQENFLLGTRPEVLEDASDELLQLIGFQPWQGYGAYEDCGEFVRRDEYTVGELYPKNEDRKVAPIHF
ncbi:MAG: phytanoyl-CoA dioxygenase family protein [Gammaproteobacteria bacterium]|nr:phytanoyl-CoA dioxygenase family protein [Gammaproteobacteria bacterium]